MSLSASAKLPFAWAVRAGWSLFTVAAFGALARDLVELEQLEAQLVRVVDDTMQPAHVGLWVRKRDR